MGKWVGSWVGRWVGGWLAGWLAGWLIGWQAGRLGGEEKGLWHSLVWLAYASIKKKYPSIRGRVPTKQSI